MPIFFISDIEGSTKKWERHQEDMSRALVRHDNIFQRNIERYRGRIIKHTGDGIFAVFEEGDPLRCAIAIQKEIGETDWGLLGELRVRIALHSGYAEKRKEDYFGPVVNRTARILAVAWGGQILVTPQVLSQCPVPAGAKIKDLGEHLLKDLGEPQQIYELQSSELPFQEFPPLRSLSAHPNNLPVQATPFVGREQELSEIEQLLKKSECRLLTLTGPGGIGKSRLALQSAASVAEEFPQGVFLIPLAPLSSGQFLVSAIAEQIKFSFYSRQEPKSQLLNYLSEKQMLLILDNFEHIIDGAEIVSAILKNAPYVKVMVTSRELLNLQGEWIYQVQGLKYPPGEKSDINEYSAVQLFNQNARRVNPNFSLSEEETEYINRICQLVGGIPLAIELASSWVRLLSPKEIMEEIYKSFDFLSSKVRDVPDRHRSLRAVFEYSWQLLTDDEKRLLARLSVFPRKFSRVAAEKIAGATLTALSSLLDKSLLIRESSGYYEMVGVLRQYAGEKLQGFNGEPEQTKNLFIEYYAEFLYERKDYLQDMKEINMMTEINVELDNIRTAWSSIVEEGSESLVEKALVSIFFIYNHNSWFKEGVDSFQKVIDRYLKERKTKKKKYKETGLLGKLYTRKAIFNAFLGFYEQAKELLNQGLKIAQDIGDKEEIGLCFNHLGNIAFILSQYEEAKKMFDAWLKIVLELNKPMAISGAYNNLGVISYSLGEFDKALELFEKSKEIAREVGYEKGIVFADSNIALILHELKEDQKAKKNFS